MTRWHELTTENVLEKLKSNETIGLGKNEAEQRLQTYGENSYEKAQTDSIFLMVINQFKDIANIILLLAGVLSLALAIREGHGYMEPVVIFTIIIMNIALAVSQERSAEKALQDLQNMNSPLCFVLREGNKWEIETANVVPGDVVLLQTGDRIPADARLLTSSDFAVDESALTGESEPVDKQANALVSQEDAPVGDRINMVFSGCLVTAGNAVAVVVETGMNTQMGKIAKRLNNVQKMQTPLQKRLNKTSRAISGIAIVSAVLLLMVGIRQGEDFWTMMLAAVSLAVAAVPETLQLIVTLSLTHGVKKMVEQNALIRKLPAVETLGNTSIICSDKTGTLTQNRMRIQKVWTPNEDKPIEADEKWHNEQQALLRYLALASNATVEKNEQGDEVIVGDATESAILRLLIEKKEDPKQLRKEWPMVGEVAFSSARKMMTTVHRCPNGGYLVLCKGAFDRLPYKATSEEDNTKRKAMHDQFAMDALRVIALASKHVESLPEEGQLQLLEKDLAFRGMIGLIDPPRKEAASAIAMAKKAGIRTVMITGDHAATAGAIAKQIGLLQADGKVMTGRQLAKMTDEELVDNVTDYSVYARVSPEDKIRIVEAWQEQGEVVSMTGDGVNDAPALKAADVGVAMGQAGTEVAKSAADMVLTDDNFATIVSAVREGRNVFSNIRKTIYFLLVCNLSEIVIMLAAQLMGWGIALTPVMLLLINVLGDGIPGLHLAKEQSDPRIMNRKPISRNESFFSGGLLRVIIQQTVVVSAVGLLAYYFGAFVSSAKNTLSAQAVGQTMTFLVVSFTSIMHVFTVRSRKSIFKRTIKDNMPIFYSALGMMFLFSIMVLIPKFGAIFGLVALTGIDWLIVGVLTVIPTVVAELCKLWDNRCESKRYQKRVVRHQIRDEDFCA